MKDNVNSPAHYQGDGWQTIDVIERSVQDAPSGAAAVSQGNAIKYLTRLWRKSNPLEDAKKARWYLDRLVQELEASDYSVQISPPKAEPEYYDALHDTWETPNAE